MERDLLGLDLSVLHVHLWATTQAKISQAQASRAGAGCEVVSGYSHAQGEHKLLKAVKSCHATVRHGCNKSEWRGLAIILPHSTLHAIPLCSVGCGAAPGSGRG